MTAEISLKGGSDDIFQRHRGFEPTPLKQQGAKRPAPNSSSESENSENIKKTIEDAVQNALKIAVAQIVTSVKTVIQVTVIAAVTNLRNDVMKSIQSEDDQLVKNSDNISICEAKLLENYNRRDILKINGVNESGPGQHEEGSETIRKVLGVAEMIGVDVKESDISIAYGLPARGQTRPIIVKLNLR